MSNQLKLTVLALLAIGTTGAKAEAATWGVAELLEAQAASAEHFKSSLGETLFGQITGLTVDLNAQKIAAKATVRYTENGAAKTVSYFCHVHGNAIDCH